MAKSDTTPAKPDIQEGAPDSFPLPLEEFCQRLSVTDRRVELIGAFYSEETRAGRVKDTESNFSARFNKFVSQPA